MTASISHTHPFDPRYGMSLEEMLGLQPPAEPDDFVPFWRDTFNAARQVEPIVRDTELPIHEGDFRIRTLQYNGWDGVTLGAWLIEPAGTAPERFIVCGHGYYNRPLSDCSPVPGAAVLYISSRGFSLSQQEGIPDAPAFHVIHGIESRERYIHRGCTADVWTGATVLLGLYPQAAGRLEYAGGSFGGGIGAMALAWDDRFAIARLGVPSFGNHPWRLQHPCVGSGESVRQKYLRRPKVVETLRYFDSAVHATHITIPTFCHCALFDPAVPPPGQFTVYNGLAGEKELFITETGHHEWEGSADDRQRQHAAEEEFVRRYLPA